MFSSKWFGLTTEWEHYNSYITVKTFQQKYYRWNITVVVVHTLYLNLRNILNLYRSDFILYFHILYSCPIHLYPIFIFCISISYNLEFLVDNSSFSVVSRTSCTWQFHVCFCIYALYGHISQCGTNLNLNLSLNWLYCTQKFWFADSSLMHAF